MVLCRLVLDQWDFKAYKSALAVDQAPFYGRFSTSAVRVCAAFVSIVPRLDTPLIDLAISSPLGDALLALLAIHRSAYRDTRIRTLPGESGSVIINASIALARSWSRCIEISLKFHAATNRAVQAEGISDLAYFRIMINESARGPRRLREFRCCNYISPLVFFSSLGLPASKRARVFFFSFFRSFSERRTELPSADYVCIAGAAAKAPP